MSIHTLHYACTYLQTGVHVYGLLAFVWQMWSFKSLLISLDFSLGFHGDVTDTSTWEACLEHLRTVSIWLTNRSRCKIYVEYTWELSNLIPNNIVIQCKIGSQAFILKLASNSQSILLNWNRLYRWSGFFLSLVMVIEKSTWSSFPLLWFT